MHGPNFLRYGNENFRGCSCNCKACREAGYFPNHDALKIPLSMQQFVLNGTARLFTGEKLQEYIDNPKKNMFLYPWHFLRQHLLLENGKWKLDYDEQNPKRYKDDERLPKAFPPPIGNIENFIETNLTTYIRPQDRWATDNSESKMPAWMLEMLEIDEEHSTTNEPSPRKQKSDKAQSCVRTQQMIGEMHRARVNCLSGRLSQLQLMSEHRLTEAKKKHEKAMAKEKQKHENTIRALETAKVTIKERDKTINERDATIKERDETIKQRDKTIDERDTTITKLEAIIEELEEKYRDQAELLKQQWEKTGQPFEYDDLCEGGRLGNHVKYCSLFDTKESNDLFLEILNFSDGSNGSFPDGDGLCENMRPYNKIKPDERDGVKAPPCQFYL